MKRLALGLALSALLAGCGQNDAGRLTSKPVGGDAAAGKAIAERECKTCHGLDGKGNGPAMSALKVPPTDLTQLACRNGGRYPEMQVFNTIAGDANVPSHGSKDMPVWGPLFSRLSESDAPKAKLRIRNLTKFIESMQAR